MLSEAKRALLNRESIVEIFVNSLILHDSAAAATRRGRAGEGGTGAEKAKDERDLKLAGGTHTAAGGGGSATLVGVVRVNGQSFVRRGGGVEGGE